MFILPGQLPAHKQTLFSTNLASYWLLSSEELDPIFSYNFTPRYVFKKNEKST